MASRCCLRSGFLSFGVTSVLIASSAFQTSVGFAQSTEIPAEKLDALTKAYAELRRENPELEERSPEQIAADVREILRAGRERMADTSAVTARSAEGSVAASARCKEGYVVERRHNANDRSVRIVSEDLHDCDARGCRAYEVNAISESAVPFQLDVSVVCSS